MYNLKYVKNLDRKVKMKFDKILYPYIKIKIHSTLNKFFYLFNTKNILKLIHHYLFFNQIVFYNTRMILKKKIIRYPKNFIKLESIIKHKEIITNLTIIN